MAILIAVPSIALATHTVYRYYEGQKATPGTNGIDGYVRGSGSAMLDPGNNAIAEWLSLVTGSGSATQWVQTGQYQGSLGLGYSPTQVHLYAESVSCNLTAVLSVDLGQPPQPNYPVYVNWAGGFNDQDCASFYFPFRVGTWTSAPVATGRMQSSSGLPQAFVEVRVRHATPIEPIGQTRFGQDASGSINSSYGLHVYTYATNNWALWTQTFPSGTTTGGYTVPSGQPNPLTYIPRRAHDAFNIDD
jgi:hypothetical protein